MTKLNESFFEFKLDSVYRIQINKEIRNIYGIDKYVYLIYQEIDGKKYIKITGKTIDSCQVIKKLDRGNRLLIPKCIRNKLGLNKGDLLLSYIDVTDKSNEYLYLKK